MILDIVKHAKQLLYDNSKSKLNSTDVQGAIDELNNSTGELSSYVDELNESLGGLSLLEITQTNFDALATKDANTLYLVTE